SIVGTLAVALNGWIGIVSYRQHLDVLEERNGDVRLRLVALIAGGRVLRVRVEDLEDTDHVDVVAHADVTAGGNDLVHGDRDGALALRDVGAEADGLGAVRDLAAQDLLAGG